MSWRTSARIIIRGVISEVGRADDRFLRRKISEAYPFGERKYHPYKIWLDEVKKQLGQPNKNSQNMDLFS